MLTTDRQTGYPSVDKPWLKFYASGAEERALDIPKNKTVWEVLEENLNDSLDVPAIEYFGKSISRQTFIEMVYTWAKAFKEMGVKEDEIVSFYGPFTPDICAMCLGLNVIGAAAYFLKLAISPEALEEETYDSKIAVVFDDMWENVHMEFTKERFEKIIVYSAADQMPFPKNVVVSGIGKINQKKKEIQIPREKRFISVAEAKKYAKECHGDYRAGFKTNRTAFITSSSGTTVGGIVKGTVATNEAAISQLYMGRESEVPYKKGAKILCDFPPTAATSLNALFLLGLFHGMTEIVDPRVTEKDFYNQIIKDKPNVLISTGAMLETFFDRIEREMSCGKSFDFSYNHMWIIGGEGAEKKKLLHWNKILKQCGGQELFNGYGCSEVFSVLSVDNSKEFSNKDDDKTVVGVGIPYTGVNIGVFDEEGNELPYNHRGELWIKSESVMQGYYRKPKETAETLVDGWVHTGDMAEISEEGFLYIYGRCKDCIVTENGEKVYLFDASNIPKRNSNVTDAVVINQKGATDVTKLYAHIEWVKGVSDKDKEDSLKEIDAEFKKNLPNGVEVVGYAQYDKLPYSPTTLKKDKNNLSERKDGFIRIE